MKTFNLTLFQVKFVSIKFYSPFEPANSREIKTSKKVETSPQKVSKKKVIRLLMHKTVPNKWKESEGKRGPGESGEKTGDKGPSSRAKRERGL